MSALLALAAFHNTVREALALVSAGLALSSLDGIAVDAAFFMRFGWRRATVYRHHPRARADRLGGDGAPMAIIVPAWDEATVIGPMLRALVAGLDYPDYRVFVGVYPNDPATQAEVAGVGDPRIVMVACTRPGPTTKADCLNHLWRAALAAEHGRGCRFKALILHDAEDVVDALELRVFDHLVPRLAMVQLPVIPLVDRGSRWISGHYLDEFAENHLKDVVIREGIGAAVPSAGVACAIERGILGQIADAAGGLPFDSDCLTEDYELGLRIKRLGGRTALARVARPGGGIVATREHFPNSLDAAVRQKTRWLLGIALHGWDRLGWQGAWADRLMLLRDRKAIVAALLGMGGYCVAALVLVDLALVRAVPGAMAFAALVQPGSTLDWTLRFTTAVLLWRLAVRAGCTARVHGWREGVRSVPRTVVGNWINAMAAWRAVRRYAAIRAGRERLSWDKTAHRFPTP